MEANQGITDCYKRFYTLHASIRKMEVNAIEKKISTELWHNRLGYMSEKGMSLLPGIEGTTLETCDDCLAVSNIEFHSNNPLTLLNQMY